jgi:signal transduction histidine kinase/ActR/RegA family two-component response regulator
MGTVAFILSYQNLQPALIGSLLTVWVLVALFFYLNRYTRRRYFAIWTIAWLFYALWLSVTLARPGAPVGSALFILQHWSVAISAVCLFWGSVMCLGLRVRDATILLFGLFLLVWAVAGRWYINDAMYVQLPIFGITGLASVFVGCAFLHLRRKNKFIGAGLLFFGFVLWGMFLVSFPIAQQNRELVSAAFVLSMVLQLFIAVAMIVLVLEEVRHDASHMRKELDSIRAENRELQMRMVTGDDLSALAANEQLPADLREAYDQLRRTQHAVVRHERLRALGQMASGIAHDINNALCPIVGFAETLLQRCALPDDARRHLGHIRTAGEDIARIVARMREFYRPRTAHDNITKVQIAPLLEEVKELTKPRWRDIAQRNGVTISVVVRADESLPSLHSEAAELREALTNLILNAVDAMPNGGNITVAAYARNSKTAVQPDIVIEVKDTGAGMTEEVRKRCLEPFFSTKFQRGGSGLGLAMVYGMVQRHRGTIEIDSRPDAGTSIRLVFPQSSAPASAATQLEPAAPGPLRILCIDDEPMLRETLQALLEQNGHRVAVAENGTEGCATFTSAQQSAEPFDVVITDLGMPGIDGVQVARRIKQDHPRTPVLLLTGWGTVVGDNASDAAAFDAILSKPPRLADILSALAKATKPPAPSFACAA